MSSLELVVRFVPKNRTGILPDPISKGRNTIGLHCTKRLTMSQSSVEPTSLLISKPLVRIFNCRTLLYKYWGNMNILLQLYTTRTRCPNNEKSFGWAHLINHVVVYREYTFKLVCYTYG